MTEPRESPRIGPEEGEDGEARPAPSRRFARMIESPASRRLALPKLVGAAVLGSMAVGLAWVGGSWVIRSVAGWVHARPEHQIAFAEITLEPEPPPWIRTGSAGILHRVRSDARLPERLSVPGVDLDELDKAFRTCPWVEAVPGLTRSYRRLTVRLVYRKPVAVAVFDPENARVVVIDKDAVILPHDDIDWAEKVEKKEAKFRPSGIDRRLLLITRVSPPASIKPGLPWKLAGEVESLGGPSHEVLGAARLAAFLQGRPKETPTGKAAPTFVSIAHDSEHLRYFVKDAGGHSVFWDQAPGAEPLGEPTAEDKWKMLLDWVDRQGPLDMKPPRYLLFTRTGAEIYPPTAPDPKPGGPR